MPKTVGGKVKTLRGVPVDTVIRVKTSARTRTKKGRAASTNVSTTLRNLDLDPTPPLSRPLDLYIEDPLSDDEQEVSPRPGLRKGPSKAVSVSSRLSPSQQALNWRNRQRWQSGSLGGRRISMNYFVQMD